MALVCREAYLALWSRASSEHWVPAGACPSVLASGAGKITGAIGSRPAPGRRLLVAGTKVLCHPGEGRDPVVDARTSRLGAMRELHD